MMQGHCDGVFERWREAELSSNATFVEERRGFGELCTGFHGIADCNAWHLQYADCPRTCLERNPSSSLSTFPCFQSAMQTSHSMVNFTTSSIMDSCQSSRSGKRKFLFDDHTRSVRAFTSAGQTSLTGRLGDSRIVSIDPPTFPVYDGPHYSRPTRTLENECLPEVAGIIGLANNSLVSQFNGLSSAATGFGSRTFDGESFIHPSFRKTSRDSYSGPYVGTYARRHHSNERVETFSSNGRVRNSFEPSRKFLFHRTGRHSLFRESASRAPQSVPPEAFATSRRLAYEPLGGMNSSYVPVHGQGTPSFISEYPESRSPTPRSAPSRIPRRRRRQRINRRRRLSQQILDQSLEYEEVDIDGPHNNMRLDVDDMSYEDLLVLGERIGNVKTGLSEDSIRKCLKMSKHGAPSVVGPSQKNEILCSICQEEYRENDELGLLVCGHSHHPACIKQWLKLKNQCPICKAVAHSEC